MSEVNTLEAVVGRLSPRRFIFEPSSLPPEAFSYHRLMTMGYGKGEAKRAIRHLKEERIFISDTYQVNVSDVHSPLGHMTWLSIKRRDKKAFHDWRELQQIKNALCGPEREGCELYPAESRLVDTSNQYHIWVLPENMIFPFGYGEREVITESKHGAVQRPFDEGTCHCDMRTKLVGDGCSVCNPEKAKEYENEET